MNLNRVELIGNLTKDIEVSYTKNQKPFINFDLAVNEPRQNQNGNWDNTVIYLKCEIWDKLASSLAAVAQKGTKVLIIGKLKVYQYETEDGKKAKSTKVRIDKFQVLSRGKEQASRNISNFAPNMQNPMPQGMPRQNPNMQYRPAPQQYHSQYQQPMPSNPYDQAMNGMEEIPF